MPYEPKPKPIGRPRHCERWPQAEVSLVLALRDETNLTLQEIAEELGRSRAAIACRICQERKKA
jgi:hypothetical protein